MAARTCLSAVFVLAVLFASASSAWAQTEDDLRAKFAALGWQTGPAVGDLGGFARITIPDGFRFLGKGDAGRFMELNENPSDGSELGVLLSADGSWFVVFEFSPEGYVKDDDRDLDADMLLTSIREGTEASNKIRRERGWSTMEIVGWQQPPFYDAQTKNLTWSIRGASDGQTSINHSTRLLGRHGVMKVNLVLSAEDVGEAIPAFNSAMTAFSFQDGQRYAEFTRGDKVAEYGLTGLIVGGAGVALVKTGLLQKFGKLIIIGLIALAAVVKRLLSSFGRRHKNADQSSHV